MQDQPTTKPLIKVLSKHSSAWKLTKGHRCHCRPGVTCTQCRACWGHRSVSNAIPPRNAGHRRRADVQLRSLADGRPTDDCRDCSCRQTWRSAASFGPTMWSSLGVWCTDVTNERYIVMGALPWGGIHGWLGAKQQWFVCRRQFNGENRAVEALLNKAQHSVVLCTDKRQTFFCGLLCRDVACVLSTTHRIGRLQGMLFSVRIKEVCSSKVAWDG